ncbi:hypothetical protein Cflav_PD2324 [Pedosphaera parvula Ellin514]|uniref:Uncharacterized protein n=1 Tax=Pedosphaera parvula (strain Ellin514) TaxID=320771 RepID=B9XKY6_PEDPL|nr:hypothetical protein Cflav_PD2324 [Pedosphaera parvula Ellin514]
MIVRVNHQGCFKRGNLLSNAHIGVKEVVLA